MQAFTFGVGNFSIEFQLLVVIQKLLSIFRSLIIPLCQFPDICIHFGNIIDMLLALGQYPMKLLVLLINKPLQPRHTILRNILGQLFRSPSLGMAVLLEALNLAAQETATSLQSAAIVFLVIAEGGGGHPVQVLGVDVLGFDPQTQKVNYFFYFFLTLRVVLSLHLEILEKRKHRGRVRVTK